MSADRPVIWPWWVAYGACVLLGNYWSLQAVKNLSPEHPDSVWRIVFWSKMLARRANFTDVGWRYRNLAILSFVAIPVIVLLHWFASAG